MNFIKSKIRYFVSLSMFREIFLYSISNGVSYISSFISVFFVARYLGPTNLGLYTFVQNYAALYITIVSGTDYYFSWSIARAEDKLKSIREYIGHKLYLSIILTFTGVFLAYLILPHDVFVLVSFFMAPLFFTSFSPLQIYSLYEKRAKLVSTLQSIAAIISLIIKISLIYFSASLKYFVMIAGLDIVILSILFIFYFLNKKYYRENLIKIKSLYSIIINLKKNALTSLSFFWTIKTSIIAIFLWQLLLRADQLILATFSNAYTLGIYAAAVKVAEIPNALASIIYLTLIGRLTHMLDSDTEESKMKIKKIFYLYIGLGVIISIFIFILAPIIIKIIYGYKFLGAESVLRIYSLSIPAVYALYYYFSIYGAKNRHILQIIIFGLSVIINIILVLVLTPILGLIGTAWATVVAYTLAALIFYKFSK